jgi:phosphopantothenoylcysteine decarboxylase / phosphopantothenate---cysteine ligase
MKKKSTRPKSSTRNTTLEAQSISTDTLSPKPFSGKKILLGVSGGIAAYKIPNLIRLLVKAGAEVQVVTTHAAEKFVAPLTLATVSKRPVLTDIFPATSTNNSTSSSSQTSWTQHIHLGEWADMVVLAPCTANTLAKLANGFADDMLSVCYLTLRADKPKLIFPAMDGEMYDAPAVQRNLITLAGDGCIIIEPETGELASGLIGKGRLPEPQTIFNTMLQHLGQGKAASLHGKKIVITSGGTRERLDSVRFITNFSSGRMGFALAEIAAQRGAEVVLITGKTHLPTPQGVTRIDVESGRDMLDAASRYFSWCDAFIGAAAVADYRPEKIETGKIKKSADTFTLNLVKNPDILLEFGKQKKAHQVGIGFALEAQNGVQHAQEKLTKKNLDMVVLNYVSALESIRNQVTLIRPNTPPEALAEMSKHDVANVIIDIASSFLAERSHTKKSSM